VCHRCEVIEGAADGVGLWVAVALSNGDGAVAGDFGQRERIAASFRETCQRGVAQSVRLEWLYLWLFFRRLVHNMQRAGVLAFRCALFEMLARRVCREDPPVGWLPLWIAFALKRPAMQKVAQFWELTR
jgi:hypothetical protein